MDKDKFIRYLPVIWTELELQLDKILDDRNYHPGSIEAELILALREEIFGAIECLEAGTCGLSDKEREDILLSQSHIN